MPTGSGRDSNKLGRIVRPKEVPLGYARSPDRLRNHMIQLIL